MNMHPGEGKYYGDHYERDFRNRFNDPNRGGFARALLVIAALVVAAMIVIGLLYGVILPSLYSNHQQQTTTAPKQVQQPAQPINPVNPVNSVQHANQKDVQCDTSPASATTGFDPVVDGTPYHFDIQITCTFFKGNKVTISDTSDAGLEDLGGLYNTSYDPTGNKIDFTENYQTKSGKRLSVKVLETQDTSPGQPLETYHISVS